VRLSLLCAPVAFPGVPMPQTNMNTDVHFDSYKEQTVIEPFSPGTNVIVGRNGSGKSNFFAAIRFVLSDAYTNMGREERQALLHEGSGSAVTSAYVEIIFDNTDKRFSEPNDEVVIRRTIGSKKDEYSVDKKVQSRADVLKILETAGFAKENPFYIVPQGRVAAITNMKESDRLNLLKEIAGTNTYDDRRIQSLKIMAETNSKREKIDELLDYIRERLSELEEEKDELRDFQEKDRERRCLEYAHWHRLQETNAATLEQIEEARHGGAGASSKDRSQLQKSEREIATMDHRFNELKQSLQMLEIERAQLDEDRKAAARAQAKAELKSKELDETRHSREKNQKKQEAELEEVRRRIKAAENELVEIIPEYEKWKSEEAEIRSQRDLAATGRKRLLDKQTHSTQFKTKAERDAYLKSEINDITSTLGAQKANEMEAKEQVKTVEASIRQLEDEIQKMRDKIEDYGPNRNALVDKLNEAQAARDQLFEERRRLQREEEKLHSLIQNTSQEMKATSGKLYNNMDPATRRGLEEIRKYTKERNTPGAYGTLAELMTVPVEAYMLPIEQVAGASLFHYVVDNEKTGTELANYLTKRECGRLTFVPLQQLHPKQVKLPRAADAMPLISKIEYDAKYEKAFQQVFGRVIICPDLPTATRYARSHGLDAITPEGDRTNKRGAMSGGYIDPGSSRLNSVQKVHELENLFDQQLADRAKLSKEGEVVDQRITAATTVVHKAEQEAKLFEQNFEPLKAELRRKVAQVERERAHLEDAQKRRVEVVMNLKECDDNLAACQAELASEFKKALSANEERQLQEFSAEMHRLQQQVKEISSKRMEAEGRKKLLENELHSYLKPKEDQLRSEAFENVSSLGGSGNYKEAAKELKRAQRAAAEVEKQVQENDEKKEEIMGEISQLEEQKAQKEQEQQELQKRIEHYQKKMEKSIQTKARLISQAAEYAKKIRDLGILPEQAFGRYEKMKSEQVLSPPHDPQ